jgi:hypothetical protein
MKFSPLISACSLLLFLSLLGCSDDEPTPAPGIFSVYSPEFFLNETWDHYFLVTDVNNRRLGFKKIIQGASLNHIEITQETEAYNIHYLRTDGQQVFLSSILGYKEDHYDLPGVITFGDQRGEFKISVEPNINPWLLSVGANGSIESVGNDPIDTEFFTWQISENASAIYFLRTKDESLHGYFLDYDFYPESDRLVINQELLSPVSELSTFTFQVPDEFNPALMINGLPEDKNGIEQPVIRLYNKINEQGAINGTPILLPVEGLKGYQTIIEKPDYTPSDYTTVGYASDLKSDTPVMPEFINADFDIVNFEPGNFELDISGNYNAFTYDIDISEQRLWEVEVRDVNLNYGAYPDFPSGFLSNNPHITLNSWREKMDDRNTIRVYLQNRMENGTQEISKSIWNNW